MPHIKCRNCAVGSHESVAEVRACYATANPGDTGTWVKGGEPGITGPQIKLYTTLVSERIADLAEAGRLIEAANGFTKREASTKISTMQARLALPGRGGQDNYADVVKGYYAVPSATGNNDYDFARVDKPTTGNWKGHTFVKRILGGHEAIRIARPQQIAMLAAILNYGVKDSGELFAKELGRCYRCGRTLTDETSRALGIGPDCRSKS